MKRWLRRSLRSAAALAAAAAAALATGSELAARRLTRVVDVPKTPLELRSDTALLARGAYLYASRGCADCHGAGGAGRTVVDDGKGMKVAAPNISPGPGSVVANYDGADWARALRHGVKPDGRPLLIMPSEDTSRLTDRDLTALVAHLRALPPAAGRGALIELPLPVRVLYGFGAIDDAAATIDMRCRCSSRCPKALTSSTAATWRRCASAATAASSGAARCRAVRPTGRLLPT